MINSLLNKIVLGDTNELIKQLPAKSIDLIVTDPPFLLGSGGGKFKEKRKYMQEIIDTEQFSGGIDGNFLNECKRVLKQFNAYFFCNKLQVKQYLDFAYENEYTSDILCWHKCLSGRTNLFANIDGETVLTTVRDLYDNQWTNKKIIRLTSPDGTFNKIVSFKKNETTSPGKIIKFRNGTSVACTNEHKFSVGGKFIKAENLIIGNTIDSGQNKININNDLIYGYDEGWFVGLYLAEGSFQKGKQHEFRFSIHQKETVFVEKIKEIVKKYGGTVRTHNAKEGLGISIVVCSRVLHGLVLEYITGDTSHYKHLSQRCWNSNMDFLQGIFDGYVDGDCRIEGDRIRTGFTDNEMLDKTLRALCNILGYRYISKKRIVKGFGKEYPAIIGRITKITGKEKKCILHEIVEIKNKKIKSYEISLEKNHKFILFDGLVTHNSNPSPLCNGVYLPDTEYIIFIKEKGVKLGGSYKTLSKYWVTPVQKNNIDHPTSKPLFLMERMVTNSSSEGDVVLDPFMGSGSTALVCKQLNRQFIGFECNQKYIDISNERLNEGIEIPLNYQLQNAKEFFKEAGMPNAVMAVEVIQEKVNNCTLCGGLIKNGWCEDCLHHF